MKKHVKKPDLINTPPHYTQASIEPIDYIRAHEMSFCEGNVIKYVTRHTHAGLIKSTLLHKQIN